jgi:hypothetical protein
MLHTRAEEVRVAHAHEPTVAAGVEDANDAGR